MKEQDKIRNAYVENDEDIDDSLRLLEMFEKYLFHWKWFIIAFIFSLLGSFIYLKFTAKEYAVSSTIFIDDEDSGGLTSEISAFEDLGILGSVEKKSVINETGVLKSRTLMENVVKELQINIRYYKTTRFMSEEIYGDDIPLKVTFFASDSVLFNLDTLFQITVNSKTDYILKNKNQEIINKVLFGKNIKTNFGEINITPLDLNKNLIGETIIVRIDPVKRISKYYQTKVNIAPESKTSSLLILSLTDNVKNKAIDIIDNLVHQYNKDAVNYKTLVTDNTDRFINDRIKDISEDLENVDKGVEDFKTKNKLTDLGIEASIDLNSNSQLKQIIVELNSQIKLVDYVEEYIEMNKESLIPANLGINDASTNLNTTNYNRLLLERNRIVKGSSKLNPTVINLDAQLKTLRQSIEQSLINLRSSLVFNLNQAKNREYQINTKRSIAPQQEREFQDIKRKQQIIESLYLYLLQKREENAISSGIPVPNAKIIDKADGNDIAVFPIPILVYLISIFTGFLLVFIIISLRSLLDHKVHNDEDLIKILDAPIIGNIPRARTSKKIIISNDDNGSVAESFRLLRTNVNFMLSGFKANSKTIFVTSTISGEGKTFVSINLAKSLSLINKKVLLIGADIRKPKIASYLKIKPGKGLTDYLVDTNISIHEIIYEREEHDFDTIVAGVIPPNPSELLLNGRFEDVLSYGKNHYDYVIVDTAPVNLVTDTLLMGHLADLTLYVVRAEFLDKRLLKIPKAYFLNKRLANMSMVINDLPQDKKGYGYGYGYGYGELNDNTSWITKVLKEKF